MPQLVAVLHSFVGLAAVLVGISGTISPHVALTGIERQIHDVETFLGVFIGSVTFTGSLIAYGKLQGLIRSKPLLLKARHGLNLAGLLACVALGVIFVGTDGVPDVGASGLRRDFRRPRHSSRDGDRRRRHAGGRLDAEQLFGLGRRVRGLHAVERPADHHRRAGRFERRDPQLHHVPGDEPLLPERHPRRLRRRGRRTERSRR